MDNIKPIPPFKRFCGMLGAFPEAFSDAMTVYEALEWLYRYLGTEVVPKTNEAIELTNQLKEYVEHYFDNLDVQEEINNKLDEMAESGQLADIIAAYLEIRSILAYDNVAAMQASTNLSKGSFAETYGFHTKNDGGTAKYFIRKVTNADTVDGMTLIGLDDETLVAQLLYSGEINVKQLGAKGDGETDEINAIDKALESADKVYFPAGTYLVSETIDITSDKQIISGNNAKIIGNLGSSADIINIEGDKTQISGLEISGSSRYGINVDGNYNTIKDCEIKNMTYSAIMILGDNNTINNVIGSECGWDCVSNYGTAKDNLIFNCKALACKRHGFSTDPTTSGIVFENCYCEDIGNPNLDEGHSSYHFEYCNNGKIINCKAIYTENHIANTSTSTHTQYIGARVEHSDNVIIDGLYLECQSGFAPQNTCFIIHLSNSKDCKVINSILINNSTNANVGAMYIQGNGISFINTTFKDVVVSEQDSYGGIISKMVDCDVTLTIKPYFANFVYLCENAQFVRTRFKGNTAYVNYFIAGRFVNTTFDGCYFDSAKLGIEFDAESTNLSNKSCDSNIFNCTFKDLTAMIKFEAIDSSTIYLTRCLFTGTCTTVIEGNYNIVIMKECAKHNLTYTNLSTGNFYVTIFDDLKSTFDYRPYALNANNDRFIVSVDGNGDVIATQE